MEDTLGVTVTYLRSILKCLNPCFNGRYSRSSVFIHLQNVEKVLILVLMEDTLGGN